MTAAVVVQLADALVARLQTVSFAGGPLTVARTYSDADELLEQASSDDTLIDVVVPSFFDSEELLTRDKIVRTVTIEIVIRRKLGPDDETDATGRLDPAAVDQLVELAERLSLAATYDRLDDFPSAAWTRSAHDPLFDRPRLRQHRQFFSSVLITFEITSAL